MEGKKTVIVTGGKDIAEAVVFLTEARQVTGEVLHADCCACGPVVSIGASHLRLSRRRALT